MFLYKSYIYIEDSFYFFLTDFFRISFSVSYEMSYLPENVSTLYIIFKVIN